MKEYLQRSTASLDGVFEKLNLFWNAQHDRISDTTARQADVPRHTHRKSLFQGVIGFVHGYALQLVLAEESKLPQDNIAPAPAPESKDRNGCTACTCPIAVSMGLPCQHKVYDHERRVSGTLLLVRDFHHHWLLKRARQEPAEVERPAVPASSMMLEPTRLHGRKTKRCSRGGFERADKLNQT